MGREWTGPARRVIVTGASRGLGRAIALRLAADGADVALVQRGAAADVQRDIAALGRRAIVVRGDLADPFAAEQLIAMASEALGGADAIVANASAIHREEASNVPLDRFADIVNFGITSLFAAVRAAALPMLKGEGGGIVIIGSVLSQQGGIRVPAYAAAKAGAANLARSLANEWAARGVRVNAVAPGYIETDQTAPVRADAYRERAITERIPAGRWGQPEDVAGAVAFLLSADARYVHGHLLAVDGGWLAR